MKKEYPTMFKLTTKDDEIEDLRCRSEKHDHDNILKSLENDTDLYKKKK